MVLQFVMSILFLGFVLSFILFFTKPQPASFNGFLKVWMKGQMQGQRQEDRAGQKEKDNFGNFLRRKIGEVKDSVASEVISGIADQIVKDYTLFYIATAVMDADRRVTFTFLGAFNTWTHLSTK